jgi:hypothetical protein
MSHTTRINAKDSNSLISEFLREQLHKHDPGSVGLAICHQRFIRFALLSQTIKSAP